MANEKDWTVLELHTSVKTILVVEDDRRIASFIVEAIKQETPHQALFAFDGYRALKIVRDLKPDFLLLDYGLPSINGLELYDHIHAIKELEHIPALLISADPPLEEAKKRNIMCLQKPVELSDLLQAIEKFLTHS
jgi:CheY-like chemotaxis protein